jgi:hypothetical protein
MGSSVLNLENENVLIGTADKVDFFLEHGYEAHLSNDPYDHYDV